MILRRLTTAFRKQDWFTVTVGTLEPYAYDKATMSKLWVRSEKDTGFSWDI